MTVIAGWMMAQSGGSPGSSAKLKAPPESKLPKVKPDPPAPETDGRPTPARAGAHVVVKDLKKGKWVSLPDGKKLWRLALRSKGAKAVRVHFVRFDAGKGTVWIHDGTGSGSSYTGKGPDEAGEFWTPPVHGERAVLEFAPQAGAEVHPLPFSVDKVSHQWID